MRATAAVGMSDRGNGLIPRYSLRPFERFSPCPCHVSGL